MKTNQPNEFQNSFDIDNDSSGIISLTDFFESNEKNTDEEDLESAEELDNLITNGASNIKEDSGVEDEDTVEVEDNRPIKPTTEDPEKNNEDEVLPSINFKSVLKNIFGEEIGSVLQENEDGEEVEIPFDELEITEELFTELVNGKIEEVKEANKDKVSVDNLTHFTKTLINIEKNGGNVQQALELYNNVQNPLESLDLEKENDQVEAVYLRFKSENYEDSVIDDLIETYKTKGTLKQKSLEAKEELEKAVKNNLEALEVQAQEREQARKEKLKEYRTSLKSELTNFKVKDSIKNKILEATTSLNKDKNYEIDSLYNSVRRDPKQVADLAFFLLNKEEYLKEATREALDNEKKNTLRKIKAIPTRQSSVSAKERKSSASDIITLDDFLK